MNVGVVGLGSLGGRIAGRLLTQGCSVGVYDTNAERVAELAQRGATPHTSISELGSVYDVVLTVLPDAKVVQQVVMGDDGLLAGLKSGSVLVDMTSSVAAVTKQIATNLKTRGIDMLDAPVSGGVKKAEQGTLAIMVGGDAAVFERVKPVLSLIGEQILHLGDIGSGHTVKALNNLIVAATLSITAEAMAVGVKMGVDAQKILDAINVGSGRSVSSETKFPQQVLSGKFEPGFSLALMSKDVGIALEMANETHVPAWIASTVHELWKYGLSQGYGDEDHTAIARVIEEFSHTKIRSQ